jgi:hypothetical protein
MNTLIGYNSPDQVIQSLYNLSVFKSYQPGFNTIITDTTTTTILDISNIEFANPGYNVLIKEPEINFSVATVGGIDNSGAILRIGLNASSIIIGQTNREININGKINASTDISYANMSTTGSIICYSTRIYHTDISGITLIPGLWTIMSTGNISVINANDSTLHWGITDNNFTNGEIYAGQTYCNIAANTTYVNTTTELLYSNTLTAILRVNDTKQIYSSVYLEGSSNMPYKLSNINSSFIAHRIC